MMRDMSTHSPRPPRRARRVLRALPFVVIGGAVAFLSFVGGAYLGITRSLPDLDFDAYAAKTPQTTKIFDNSDPPVLLAELRGLENRKTLAGDQIPQIVRDAVVAAEDESFYAHRGISVFSLLHAAWDALRGVSSRQESSTITQQLVKNAFVTPAEAADPELAQAALAYRLEGKWSKDKILNEFLNVAYFGEGAYGIQAAAAVYFDVAASELDLAQAALLAGLLESPATYSPMREPKAALARRDAVLNKMYQQHYITSAQLQEALAAPLRVREGDPADADPLSPWVDLVREQLVARYGASAVLNGGLRVHTSLDSTCQAVAEDAVSRTLQNAGSPDAALVSLDLRTGSIVALLGVSHSGPWRPDGTSPVERHLGTAFHPFVLLTALAHGLSPETALGQVPDSDQTTDFLSGADSVLSIADVTAQVSSTAYVQLAERLGPQAITQTAHNLGLLAPSGKESAAALGSGILDKGVNLFEVTQAYAALASSGERLTASVLFDTSQPGLPISILRVYDSAGALIDQNDVTRAPGVEPGLAEIATGLLTQVVTRGAAKAADIGRSAAAQPGSTPDDGDAWFIGYTPELLTVVWVGYPDRSRPLRDLYGEGVTGTDLAAQIWTAYMNGVLADRPPTTFSDTHLRRFVTMEVCRESGLLPAEYCSSTTKMLFRTDKIPVELCPLHSPKEVAVPQVTGLPAPRAVEILTGARFRVSEVMDRLSLRPAGTVVEQRPAAGSLLLQGRSVIIVVSTGENRATVPKLTGLLLEDALRKLAAAGLEADVTYLSDPAAVGTVLSQDPASGKVVARKSKVRLTVSSGPAETPPST